MTTPSVSPASSGEQLGATADFLRASRRVLSRAFEKITIPAGFSLVAVAAAAASSPVVSAIAGVGAVAGFARSLVGSGSRPQKAFRALCCVAVAGLAYHQYDTTRSELVVRAENQVRFGRLPITQGDQLTLTTDQLCAFKPATTPMLNGDFVIARSARTGQQIRVSCD